MSPVELAHEGLVGPIRIRLKDEPRAIKRRFDADGAELGNPRWRNAIGVSLVAELVGRISHAPQNNAEISIYESIPPMPGLGFFDDMKTAHFSENAF